MTVVIGYGHPDRCDDCAGLLVVRGLRATTINCVEVYADGLELLDAWSGFDRAIIVDAVVSGAKPGTIYRWHAEKLQAGIAHPLSTHGFGLVEAITLAGFLSLLPQKLEVIGIEAAHFEYGRQVSKEVATAARSVVRELTAELVPANPKPRDRGLLPPGSL
jgi:hydrogenase maturation protease